MDIEVIQADYRDVAQAKEIAMLLNAYASDPMGGGRPLAGEILDKLADELARLPHAFSVIAYADSHPVGLANCFELFSTFLCRPLVNIHDMVVLREFRERGISRKILEKVEEIALQKGCCKLTLEVLSGNEAARLAYQKFGFSSYELDPTHGQALFWQKLLA
ncbi:MAG: histone acetyltransferase HPA2 [Gammaproteobacteria bacterium]|nr:histone acetyltransferase HPA2 [Gammaproteobacteria bacterium]